jgi:hypothetical protein
MKDVRKDILWRVYLVYMVMLLFGAAIILKVLFIQTFERGSLMDKSKKQSLQYFEVEAIRGNICDANGNLLVTSVPILLPPLLFQKSISKIMLEVLRLVCQNFSAINLQALTRMTW